MKRTIHFISVGVLVLLPLLSFTQLINRVIAQSANCESSTTATIRDTIEVDGAYTFWVLMKRTDASAAANAGISIDGRTCHDLVTPNSQDWEWVSGTGGNIVEDLTAGSYDIKIGIGEGTLQFDKVIATDNPNCKPEGDGGNCLEKVLDLNVMGLDNPGSVSTDRSIEAIVLSKPQETVTVNFYIDDRLITSKTSAPYCMVDGSAAMCGVYDFQSLGQGDHILRVESTSGNSDQIWDKSFSFTVVPSDGTPAPEVPILSPTTPEPTPQTPSAPPSAPTPPAIPQTPAPVPAKNLPDLTVTVNGITDNETISGSKAITASVPETDSARVTFTLSGRSYGTDTSAPYCLERAGSVCDDWDTNSVPNGEYELVITASADGYDSASTTRKLKISNSAPAAAGVASSRPAQEVVVGKPNQQITGTVKLSVPASQVKPGSKITYAIDKKTIATTTASNPSAIVNTNEIGNGKKKITATVQTPSGSKSVLSGNVTVRNDSVTASSNWFRDNMIVFIGAMIALAVGLFFAIRFGFNWYRQRKLTSVHNFEDSYSFVQPQEQAMGHQFAAAGMAVLVVFAVGALGSNINQSQAAVGNGFNKEVEQSIRTGMSEIGMDGPSIEYVSLTFVAPTPSPTPPTPPTQPENPPAQPPTPPVTPPPPAPNPVTAQFAYVGGYSEEGTSSNLITAYRRDSSTGILSQVSTTNSSSPSFLVANPRVKDYIYTVNQFQNTVQAFRINQQNGSLTATGSTIAVGGLPVQVSIDQSGRNLLVANYTGSSWSVVSINEDGSLGSETHRLTSVHEVGTTFRQLSPHPHGTTFDPSGKYAAAADLGTDTVDIFQLVNGRINITDTVKVAPGSGPRQTTFSRDGRFLYVLNELNSTITAYPFNSATGQLDFELQTILLQDQPGASSAAEILAYPGGSFLYASQRSGGNSPSNVVGFAIDAGNGRLTKIGTTSDGINTPRTMGFGPNNDLYVLNQGAGSIIQYRIDTSNGALQPVNTTFGINQPTGITFTRF